MNVEGHPGRLKPRQLLSGLFLAGVGVAVSFGIGAHFAENIYEQLRIDVITTESAATAPQHSERSDYLPDIAGILGSEVVGACFVISGVDEIIHAET